MYTLRKYTDPILKAKCLPIAAKKELSFLFEMRELCKLHNGVGLAAPQIGVQKRAVFIMPTGRGRCYFLINPVITRHSEQKNTLDEGCLSYPNFYVPVERWTWIEYDALDSNMKPIHSYASDWEARVIQHEIDHLDGICHVGYEWHKRESGLI